MIPIPTVSSIPPRKSAGSFPPCFTVRSSNWLGHSPFTAVMTQQGGQLPHILPTLQGLDYTGVPKIFEAVCQAMKIIPFESQYRDDMIFMVLEAKNTLGRIPS